nr:tRNA adenosine(34) deaminase TadA [Desulfovibrio inopinatus]
MPSPPPGWTSWEQAMRLALEQAERAGRHDDVPVGAVIIGAGGELLAEAGNETIRRNDPTAHAEIVALRRAATALSNYRLTDTVMCVTLEPCLMCVGALVHARVKTLIYGATDPKTGAARSKLDGFDLPFLNHRVEVIPGLLEEECSQLIKDFFRQRRAKKNA